MRALAALALALVAACSTDRGTIFTLHGTGEAKSFEVILAEPNIALARVQQRDGEVPFSSQEQALELIDYYRQRDTTKRIPGGVIEGFRIRVEPVEGDANYIPFVLAFDADEGGNVVAIGHFGSVPAKIALPQDRVTLSDITLEAVARTTNTSLEPGTVFQGACADATVTGYAWRRATGESVGSQLRLVVTPQLDLDCDGVEVSADATVECNDLSAAFSNLAPETCPTEFDFDCDNRASDVMPCSFGGANGDACVGMQACSSPSVCIPQNDRDEVCACAQDRCNGCILDGVTIAGGGLLTACAPASAKIQNACNIDGGCRITVEESPSGWLAGVANSVGPLGVATTVGRGDEFFLAVSSNAGTVVELLPNTPVGNIVLRIAPIQPASLDRPIFRLYRLRMQESPGADACDQGSLPMTSAMDCTRPFALP